MARLLAYVREWKIRRRDHNYKKLHVGIGGVMIRRSTTSIISRSCRGSIVAALSRGSWSDSGDIYGNQFDYFDTYRHDRWQHILPMSHGRENAHNISKANHSKHSRSLYAPSSPQFQVMDLAPDSRECITSIVDQQ